MSFSLSGYIIQREESDLSTEWWVRIILEIACLRPPKSSLMATGDNQIMNMIFETCSFT